MIHRHLPSDPRIVDEVFSLRALNGHHDVGWLMGMVATFGKTPKELKGFTWNDDDSINLLNKKRPVRPLHPQWVFLFSLKEKQPLRLRSRWDSILNNLGKALERDDVRLSVEGLLLAYKVRKVYYTPIKRQENRCLVPS